MTEKTLVQKRGTLKSSLSRFEKFVSDVTDDPNNSSLLSELQIRLERVELLWNDFEEIQTQIEQLNDTDQFIANQEKERELFEIKYFAAVGRARKLLEEGNKNKTVNATMGGSSQGDSITQVHFTESNLKLPQVPLPEFHGQYDKWLQFRDAFTSLIHNNVSLSNVQKFYYLNGALKGDASAILTSLEITDANYEIAWDLLKKRFENKKAIINSHIQGVFELQSVGKENNVNLRRLSDEFQKHFRSLEKLNQPVHAWGAMLIYLLTSKLDFLSKREWEVFSKNIEEPTINDFLTFINERCRLLESISSHKAAQVNNTVSRRSETKSFLLQSKQERPCAMCKGGHAIFTCKEFTKLSISDRISEARKLRLCTNCLRPGHTNSECKGGPCKKCGRRHNTSLHLGLMKESDQKPGKNDSSESNVSAIVTAHCYKENTNLLSTAMINVINTHGEHVQCRALLDSGSQSNFITRNLFNELKLNAIKINLPVTGISMSTTSIDSKTEAVIKSRVTNFEIKLPFLIINNITEYVPYKSFSVNDFNIPSTIELADPRFNMSQKIDVLLGVGIFFDLIGTNQIKLGQGQPTLQSSKLGWIVAGPATIQSVKKSKQSCFLNVANQLEKFWRVEDYGSQKILLQEELDCEAHFLENTYRDITGRFVVKLPLKQGHNRLGDSKETAIKRFLAIERKLLRDVNLRTDYTRFMTEYQTLGHMTRVTTECDSNLIYYLPHHAVTKHTSTTTKLRVVFDASSKTSTNVSLNDVLAVGPTVQDDLLDIVLRFRTHFIAITADIEKMYRQINIHECHRDLQRIVWRDDPNSDLNIFRLNTVTYGTGPASFLATRSLQKVAQENVDKYPNASKVICSDFYMDDLITGATNVESAIRLKTEIEEILESAGFKLRKWQSNEMKVFDETLDTLVNSYHYIITDDQMIKTLGIVWSTDTDAFHYINSFTDVGKCTKRTILSQISQIFDPLGLIGPIIITAKIILQRLWQLNLSWDQVVPPEILNRWRKYRDELRYINQLEIPRRILVKNYVNVEVHGFCDASASAYGSCVYLKSTDGSNTETHLICAKSRVAPLKTLSLPRLELCGAVLLTHLTQRVKHALRVNITNTFYWCDSSIVLHWISAESGTLNPFVAHRVADIQRNTESRQWRHVSSENNPADLISRGSSPMKLKNSLLWWNGPEWLKSDSPLWPVTTVQLPANMPEYKASISLISTVKTNFIFNKFSNFGKLVRVTAYLLRFVHNTLHKNDRIVGFLTVEDVEKATMVLARLVQLEAFPEELRFLKQSKSVSSHSKLLCLNPFVDNEGIIRVGGRLNKGDLPYNYKHPIVLPKDHVFTKLLIEYEHRKNLHAGALAILARIRQSYWPLSGRGAVRAVLRKCLICFKINPRNIYPLMGALPRERVTINRVFANAGLDYAGPFLIRDGKLRNRKIIKCYVCIFICFSTKATHIELVSDLTTEGFLNALKRFVSRRGLCQNIYCDNATNFVGACNELSRICSHSKDSKIQHFCIENKIRFHFIPARSPHFGGLWEAAVKSAKSHLKKIMKDVHLTYEEFYTLLTQIEATMNSRPLYPLTNDPNDLESLTPGHFLIGSALNAMPQLNVLETPCNRLNSFKHLQQMYQHFWKRWQQEYLHTLHQRNKWRFQTSNLKTGSLVILKEDNTPPLTWALGRIVKTHPGDDGIVRVVRVRVKGGEVLRPITKICLLPIDTEDNL